MKSYSLINVNPKHSCESAIFLTFQGLILNLIAFNYELNPTVTPSILDVTLKLHEPIS